MSLLASIRVHIQRRRRRLVCRDAVGLITEYLEGALSERESRRFEAHLGHCDACRAYLDQMRATVETLGHLRASEIPDDVMDELVALYRRLRVN